MPSTEGAMSNNQMWDNRERGWGNTKRSAWIMLALCAAISIGFGFSSGHSQKGIDASQLVGRSIGIFIMTGIIPLIWWGIVRFRYDRSFGPLFTWLILVVVLGYMSHEGMQMP
jgi:hypothetical protein